MARPDTAAAARSKRHYWVKGKTFAIVVSYIFCMVRKSIQAAESNYAQAASLVPERIRAGVRGARWQEAAGSDSAEANFKASMTKALADQSRKKGVMRTSNQEWENRAANSADLAAQRMGEERAKYAQRFTPILQAMNSAAEGLPARTLDANTNIDKRLKPVVKAAQDAAMRR